MSGLSHMLTKPIEHQPSTVFDRERKHASNISEQTDLRLHTTG